MFDFAVAHTQMDLLKLIYCISSSSPNFRVTAPEAKPCLKAPDGKESLCLCRWKIADALIYTVTVLAIRILNPSPSSPIYPNPPRYEYLSLTTSILIHSLKPHPVKSLSLVRLH